MSPYTVSKHGVVALTRTMAKDDSGVMHKAICPAWTDTNIVSRYTDCLQIFEEQKMSCVSLSHKMSFFC